MRKYLFLIILNLCFSVSPMAMNMDKNQNMDGKEVVIVPPPEAMAQHKKALKDIEEKGYIDLPDTISDCEFVLNKIHQAYALARHESRAINYLTSGFVPMDQYVEDDSDNESVTMNPIPESIRKRGSEDYVIPYGDVVRRVYSHSRFGPLLVKESFGTMDLALPNLTIAGYPAKWIVQKHTDDKWSTTVRAEDGKKTYQIESGRRLKGKKLHRFLQFARKFVEGG